MPWILCHSSRTPTDKNNVVRLIELTAIRLGLNTRSPQETRLYGGHSLRVSAAQWVVRSGIPLLLIQLMARWSSDVIALYVAEVPLETISNVYKGEAAIGELHTLLDEARWSCEVSGWELHGNESHASRRIPSIIEEVSDFHTRSSAGESVFSPPFVVKTQGGGKPCNFPPPDFLVEDTLSLGLRSVKIFVEDTDSDDSSSG